jgi:hypothetical protein
MPVEPAAFGEYDFQAWQMAIAKLSAASAGFGTSLSPRIWATMFPT